MEVGCSMLLPSGVAGRWCCCSSRSGGELSAAGPAPCFFVAMGCDHASCRRSWATAAEGADFVHSIRHHGVGRQQSINVHVLSITSVGIKLLNSLVRTRNTLVLPLFAPTELARTPSSAAPVQHWPTSSVQSTRKRCGRGRDCSGVRRPCQHLKLVGLVGLRSPTDSTAHGRERMGGGLCVLGFRVACQTCQVPQYRRQTAHVKFTQYRSTS